MSSILKTWTPEDVAHADDPYKAFCSYVQQSVGIPYPTGKDIAIVRKKAKDFFEMYPAADWFTLCRIAQWAKSRKKRPPRIWMLIDKHRDAWAAGVIPEISYNAVPEDIDVEAGIAKALDQETRPGWRRRLTMARGPEFRKGVLLEWLSEQKTDSHKLSQSA